MAFSISHSQLLAALKTYLIWMTRNDKVAIENIKLIVDITLPVINDTVPVKVSNSAAHLFRAVSTLSCAPDMVLIPEVAHFINMAPNLAINDNRQTNYVVFSAISNLLLRPWTVGSPEKVNHRNLLVDVFFDGLTWTFKDLTPSSGEGRVSEVVENTLPALSHIVDFCKDFPVASKKRLFQAISCAIQHAVVLFPVYAKSEDVSNCILLFFLTVLRVLQQQLGVEGTKSAVQVFLDVATK